MHLGVIQALTNWGDAVHLSLLIHHALRASGRRGGSLIADVAHMREVEGAARFH
jgi:hypothetical protein